MLYHSSAYRWFLKCNGFKTLSLNDLQVMVGYFVVYLPSDLREEYSKTKEGCIKYLDSHFEGIKQYVHERGNIVNIELDENRVITLKITPDMKIQEKRKPFPIPQIDYIQNLRIPQILPKPPFPMPIESPFTRNPYDSDVYNFLYDCNGHQHLSYCDLYQIVIFFSKVLNLQITKEDTKVVSNIIKFMTKHFLEIAKYLIENKIVEIQLYKKKIMLQFVLLSRYPVYHRAFIY